MDEGSCGPSSAPIFLIAVSWYGRSTPQIKYDFESVNRQLGDERAPCASCMKVGLWLLAE
jgi:hypothetical protein